MPRPKRKNSSSAEEIVKIPTKLKRKRANDDYTAPKQVQYSQELINTALEAVEMGSSINQASKAYKLPLWLLHKKIKLGGKSPQQLDDVEEDVAAPVELPQENNDDADLESNSSDEESVELPSQSKQIDDDIIKSLKHPTAVIDAALEAIEMGASINQASKAYNIHYSMLHRILKADNGSSQQLDDDVEVSDLQQAEDIEVQVDLPEEDFDEKPESKPAPYTRQSKYPQELIDAVIKSVKMGASINQASKAYDLPYQYMCRYFRTNRESSQGSQVQKHDDETESHENSMSAFEEEFFPIINVKPEMYAGDSTDHLQNHCCVCLAQENILPALKTQLVFLDQFVDGGLRGFEFDNLKICKKCSDMTQKIMDFKQTCAESLKSLEEMIKSKPIVDDRPPSHSDRKIEIKQRQGAPKVTVLMTPAQMLLLNSKCYCSHCSHFFSEALENHYTRVHANNENNSWSCKSCNLIARTKEAFLEHFEAEHIRFPEPQKCPSCDSWFEYREPYKMHIGSHSSEYQCEHCNQRFYQWRLMRQHVEMKHLGLKRCKQCQQSFATDEELKQHEEQEKLVRQQNKCENCGRTYVDRQSLNSHKNESQCNTENLTCEQCGESCVSKHALKYHQKAKHQELKHLCTYCGKKFVLHKRLASHIAEIHESNKHDPFTCDDCGKVFPSSLKLRGHITTVHSEEKYDCKLCDKKFKQKHTFERHQFTHTDKLRPYGCHLCPVGYYRTIDLKRHYDRTHQLSLTQDEVRAIYRRTRISMEGVVEVVANNQAAS